MRSCLARPGLCVLCSLTFAGSVGADEALPHCDSDAVVGEVISVQGEVDVLDAGGKTLRRLLPGTGKTADADRLLCAGEMLQTGLLARATLAVTKPPSVIRLDANTLLATRGRDENEDQSKDESTFAGSKARRVLALCRRAADQVWLDLRRGVLRLFTTEPTPLDISTPYLNASVEGTEFSLLVGENTSTVTVIEGVVDACNTFGNIPVRAGKSAVAVAGEKPAIVDSGNSVRWALHYPVLGGNGEGTSSTRAARELIAAGRVEDALEYLGNDQDAVDLSLRAIIAITAGENGKARQLAQRAEELNNRSPIAWIALSYVQQADYELTQALESAVNAARLAQQDPTVLSRHAELELIAGNVKNAERIARRAVLLGPELSRTHTVLGFIGIGGYDMKVAEASFLRAIARDETDPLPRLGLGLIDIRRGETAQALLNLEAAVSLDPESALLRVYLGRAYALDGRAGQALDQFRLAEEIDGSDPLPHLYRAFFYHASNDTYKALGDLQAAVEKNDNRGVFRTRSFLDADLATTLASRGHIYEAVGFRGLTLGEGTDALHRNPRDYSAHRLMADAYRSRPRHEIARASEQLQAQIRQPLNSNPVPSSLGLSRLDDYPDIGPRAVSFNEYARLFSRQGFTSTVTRTTGPHDTQASEVQANWLLSRTLASANVYRFESDGLAFNQDGRLQLASIFLQRWFGRELSAQIELSDSQSEQGADREPRFDRENYNLLDRLDEERERARLGLRWSYSPTADLYLNHDYSTFGRRLEHEDNDTISRTDTDSHHSELQVASRSSDVERVVGVGYSSQQSEESCRGSPLSQAEVDHSVAYAYVFPSHQFAKNSGVDYTLGIGLDDLDLRGVRSRNISPKLGVNGRNGRIRWRSVLARTITRTLATNRTLEPTQVAGFNQLYDDFAGTVSTIGGVGAGLHLGPVKASSEGDTYLDVELVHRHLDKPTATDKACPPGRPSETTEFEERRYSIGVYNSTRWLSVALQYEYEEYISPSGARSQEFFVNSTTDRISVDLGVRLNRHIQLSFKPQYITQRGTFFNPFETRVGRQVYPGRDSFWTVDAALRFQLDAIMSTRFAGFLSIEFENLFDKEFNFQESDPNVPSVSYERTLTARLQMSFD
ncbi:MAG: FecR domain-containing protein [Granulosicoccus sp.]